MPTSTVGAGSSTNAGFISGSFFSYSSYSWNSQNSNRTEPYQFIYRRKSTDDFVDNVAVSAECFSDRVSVGGWAYELAE